MTDAVRSLLAWNDGCLAKAIDLLRDDPAAANPGIMCDAIEDAGGTVFEVVELYADPPAWREAGLPLIGPGVPAPAEDDSLRPLLAAWAESRVSGRMAGRVRAWKVERATHAYTPTGVLWLIHPDNLHRAEANRDHGWAMRSLKRHVLQEFLDAPVPGPHAGRRATRRALRTLRERIESALLEATGIVSFEPPGLPF